MSAHNASIKRKTIRDIVGQKGKTPIVSLTAYTAPMARMIDPHADFMLVGDSLGMVLYGLDSTIGVSLEMMVNHGRAVVKASQRALVLVDMPFGSYQESPEQAFHNAALVMKETGAGGVKLEGGAEMAETVKFVCERGIPVLGHIGLQPQSVHAAGGYRVMGRDDAESLKIANDAKALADAGAFGVVLECIDPDLAETVTQEIAVPTIGIGASAACDGQILVTDDMLGLTGQKAPKFVKPYADLAPVIEQAVGTYADEVRARAFPGEENIYKSTQGRKRFKVMKQA